MAITRRQFLQRSSAVSAGALFGPSFYGNPFVREAFASTIGDRYLVVLFLDGGNDGLNTITPQGAGALRSAYTTARKSGGGGLQLSPSEIVVPTNPMTDPATGTQIGFHPGLAGLTGTGGLRALYDDGNLAVIQGCGYPDYNLSHDESRAIWQTANPQGVPAFSGVGWIGRHLAANYAATDVPGVCIADSIALEMQQSATGVLGLPSTEDFGFPYDDDYSPSDDAAKRTAFSDLHDLAAGSAQATLSALGNIGTATLIASESYPACHTLYETDRAAFSQAYTDVGLGEDPRPGRSTARDLREVAKIIYGVENTLPNVNARFFRLDNGGYDTHSDQGAAQTDGQHYLLHREVGDAVKVFFDDLADMGNPSGSANGPLIDRVLLVVYSEFSRRIIQNQNGTDHGSQGPMFVVGGSVNGGLYGNHPDIITTVNDYLADPDGAEGNTTYSQAGAFASTDFRDVYGTILQHWLNMTPATIIPGVLQTDTVPGGGDPDDYWTAADLDMGFL